MGRAGITGGRFASISKTIFLRKSVGWGKRKKKGKDSKI